MFPNDPTEYVAARRVCRSCPVQVECLADAIDFARSQGEGRGSVHGVWAGLTGSEVQFLAWQSRDPAGVVAAREMGAVRWGA